MKRKKGSNIKGKNIKAVGISMFLVGALAISTYASDYEHHWAKEPIDKWSSYDIVKGYEDGSFKPDSKVTRAELGAFVMRTFKYEPIQTQANYADVREDAWYSHTARMIKEKQLMYIQDEAFKADIFATREEAAYLLAKAYHINPIDKELTFKDGTQISEWARGYVSALVEKGYMVGNPDGTFGPQNPVTRAQIITMLDHITTNYISKEGTYETVEKGNVLVNAPGIILKNIVIEGNLYLAEGIGDGEVTCDNVVVKGATFIEGGTVSLSGDFENIDIYTTYPIHLVKGKVNELNPLKEGAQIRLEKEFKLNEKEIAKEEEVKEEVATEGGAGINLKEQLALKSASIKVSGKEYPLDTEGNTITLDVQALTSKFSKSAIVQGVKIEANVKDARVKNGSSSLDTDSYYTLRNVEDSLGLVREAAKKEGLNVNSFIDSVLPQGSLSIGTLLEKYGAVKNLADIWNINIQSEYNFTRKLEAEGKTASSINIRLLLP